MRLPALPPSSVNAAQRALYGDMRTVIDSGFGELVAYRGDGALIGEATYRAVVARFGEQGAAGIVFLVGCFSMVAVTLNAFDAGVPGREET